MKFARCRFSIDVPSPLDALIFSSISLVFSSDIRYYAPIYFILDAFHSELIDIYRDYRHLVVVSLYICIRICLYILVLQCGKLLMKSSVTPFRCINCPVNVTLYSPNHSAVIFCLLYFRHRSHVEWFCSFLFLIKER